MRRPLDAVVVTSVGEYLPASSGCLGKTALGKLFPEMNLGAPRIAPAKNLHRLQDLLKKYPPRRPGSRSIRRRISPRCRTPAAPPGIRRA